MFCHLTTSCIVRPSIPVNVLLWKTSMSEENAKMLTATTAVYFWFSDLFQIMPSYRRSSRLLYDVFIHVLRWGHA